MGIVLGRGALSSLELALLKKIGHSWAKTWRRWTFEEMLWDFFHKRSLATMTSAHRINWPQDPNRDTKGNDKKKGKKSQHYSGPHQGKNWPWFHISYLAMFSIMHFRVVSEGDARWCSNDKVPSLSTALGCLSSMLGSLASSSIDNNERRLIVDSFLLNKFLYPYLSYSNDDKNWYQDMFPYAQNWTLIQEFYHWTDLNHPHDW